jgi:GNAT superfamily N-acetyltransferase
VSTATRTISTTELELSEARAWSDLYRFASPAAIDACGLDVQSFGSADAVVAVGIDVLAFNRVIGFGAAEPADESAVDKVVEWFRSAGAGRFFLQLSPGAEPAQTAGWLESRGFRHHNNWVKLYRPVADPPWSRSDLRVEQIGPARASAFGAIAASCFGWPAFVGPWVACLVGKPHWRHYLAFDGDEPVATAAMRVVGNCGWVDFAATLPEYRGRGAQGALLERRVRDAAGLGLTHLVVETAEPTPDRPSPSYRNTLRSGFRVAYNRPNYLFEA